MAGGPDGDQHHPASNQAPPGSSSAASGTKAACHTRLAMLHIMAAPGMALVGGWDSRRGGQPSPPTPLCPLGCDMPAWGHTASAPHLKTPPDQDISPIFEGGCLQQSRRKQLGEWLGQVDQQGRDPQYLLETHFVSSTNTKYSSLILTHCNNHPPCDK